MNTVIYTDNHLAEFPTVGRIFHKSGSHVRPKRSGSAWRVERRLVEQAATQPLSFSHDGSCRTVRILEGEVELVVADMRADSADFGRWSRFAATASPGETWTAPEGFALGWQAISEYALVETGCSAAHYFLEPDDEDLDVDWPLPVGCVLGVEEVLEEDGIAHAYDCLGPTTIDWWAEDQRTSVDEQQMPVAKIEDADKHDTVNELSRSDVFGEDTVSLTVRRHTEATREEEDNPAVLNNKPHRISTPLSGTSSRKSKSQPTILVFGSTGQLGKDLCKHFRKVGRVIGACKTPSSMSVFPMPMRVDLGRPASIRDVIRRTRPTLIVNAAAMTNVDAVESAPRLAQSINANAPAIMATEAEKVGASMLHFCSDKVYSGTGESPWKETDAAAPMNQYGLTKLRGTEAVLAARCPAMVVRTGWLYSSHGNNFVQNLIDLMTYRSSIALTKDCYGSPTSTDWLARTIVDQLAGPIGRAGLGDWMQASGGLYNLTTLGFANRLEVGDFIASLCRQHCVPIVAQLKGKRLAELAQTPSPANCRLDITRYTTAFRIQPPSWQDEMSRQVGLLVGAADAQLLSIA